MKSFNTRYFIFDHYVVRLLLIIGIQFALFTGYRLVFYLMFSDSGLTQIGLPEIFRGFLLGIRFDSATITYGMLIPILFLYLGLIIPFRIYYKGWLVFSRIWMSIIIVIFIMALIIDLQFFEFFHDHLNFLVFKLYEDDAGAILSTIAKNYPVGWYLLLAGIGIVCMIYLISRVMSYPEMKNIRSVPRIRKISVISGFFLLTVLLGRASFGLFPINLMDAAYSRNSLLNKLGPNPVFTLEKAIKVRVKKKNAKPFWQLYGYKDHIDEAFSLTNQHFTTSKGGNTLSHVGDDPVDILRRFVKINPEVEENPPHVVMAIMEGFGSWILDYNSDEFQIAGGLETWFNEGIYWDHFISSGQRSIESLSAILLSVPPIPQDIPVSQVEYSLVPFASSLARVFKSRGYETRFVYGGKLSWQRLNDFLPNQGFDHLHGDGDYDARLPRTDWGVFDEELFKLVLRLLKEAEKPQLIVLMTTTNHPPFQLPENYIPLPLNIPTEVKNLIQRDPDQAMGRFRVYQYANQVLSTFLDSVNSCFLGDNTIVAITGDHNFGSMRYYPDSDLLDFIRVPFYLYVPDRLGVKPQRLSNMGSHVDIAPTLYELALSDAEYLSFGRNLLTVSNPENVVHENGWLFSSQSVVKHSYDTGQTTYLEWLDENRNKLRLMSEINQHEQKSLELMNAYFSASSYYFQSRWEKYYNTRKITHQSNY